jgi:type III secretion protein I
MSDVERFRNALMTAPSTDAGGPSPLSASQVSPSPVGGSPATNTLGDAILNTLQTASTQMTQSWQQAAQAVSHSDLNMADMLSLQMAVIQTSIQYELLGKGIGKTTQNLDQILKTQ